MYYSLDGAISQVSVGTQMKRMIKDALSFGWRATLLATCRYIYIILLKIIQNLKNLIKLFYIYSIR